MGPKVVLAKFGIEIRVPANRTDKENDADLERVEGAIKDHLRGIAKMIEANIEGAEVVEDRR